MGLAWATMFLFRCRRTRVRKRGWRYVRCRNRYRGMTRTYLLPVLAVPPYTINVPYVFAAAGSGTCFAGSKSNCGIVPSSVDFCSGFGCSVAVEA